MIYKVIYRYNKNIFKKKKKNNWCSTNQWTIVLSSTQRVIVAHFERLRGHECHQSRHFGGHQKWCPWWCWRSYSSWLIPSIWKSTHHMHQNSRIKKRIWGLEEKHTSCLVIFPSHHSVGFHSCLLLAAFFLYTIIILLIWMYQIFMLCSAFPPSPKPF